jgi:hypothetical protein
MTLKYLAGNQITGLSSDTKPTLIPTTSTFLETDTNQLFIWNGSSWSAKATDTAYTYTIYKTGTTVKAKNNTTGAIDYSGDATVDCTPTIYNAANNAHNVGSGDDGSGFYGSGIFIKKGVYKCVTAIDLIAASGGMRHGMSLIGEGRGSVLSWEPSGALDHGLNIKMNNCTISDITFSAAVTGNTNISHLILGESGNTAATWCLNLKILNCILEGANAYTTEIPVINQNGIRHVGSGTAFTEQPYYWKIHNCSFNYLDKGIYQAGANASHLIASSCDAVSCNTAVYITGKYNLVQNWYIQGTSSVGTTGVHLVGSTAANSNIIDNISTEIGLVVDSNPANCQAVLLDSGVLNNRITNIYNGLENGSTYATIRDNSCTARNNIVNPLFFRGLSTDTKPTSGIPAGARYLATDTRIEYVYNGSTWSAMA